MFKRAYGKRFRDVLPWINSLEDFVEEALENNEKDIDLSVKGETGFYDTDGSKSNWTLIADAGDLRYVEDGSAVPGFWSSEDYRSMLEDLASEIEELADEEVHCEIDEDAINISYSEVY